MTDRQYIQENNKITNRDIVELSKEFDTHVMFTENHNDPEIEMLMITTPGGGLKTFNLPKKQVVDKQWVANKMSQYLNSSYTNLRDTFSKLGLKGNIYYTSFGFSYDCFMKSKPIFESEANKLKQILDDLGIEYTNEFSDACWVYRFRISQKQDNINKLKNL